MRALVCAPEAEERIRFSDVAEPVAGPDEVLIEVKVVSLNLGELRRLSWEQAGWRPGYDVAGVVACGAPDGSGPPPGTRVVGLLQNGAWAERVAVKTRYVAPIPGQVDFARAATVPVAGLTSLSVLAHAPALLNRHVLVTGAAGGVGRFAIQLAALGGARVTASVGRPERGAGLQALGASTIEVGVAPEGALFDLVLESIGGEVLGNALARLAPGGVLVSIGGSSDTPTTFDVLSFVRKGATQLYGLSLFTELERNGMGRRELSDLLELVASGRLDPQIGLRTGWRDAAQALRALRERRVVGKAVLVLD